MSWGAFFKAVLPSTTAGIYAIVRGANGAANEQIFANSVDELGAYADLWQISAPDGKNTWYSIGQLEPAQAGRPIARRLEQLQANRAFVLDIDVKPDDAQVYNAPEEALAALKGLIDSGEVPRPSFIIDSGGGFHVYWCVNRDMPAGEHARRASVFASKLRHLDPKLAKDAALTRNSVCLFRLPGSWNEKYRPPRRVQLLTDPALTANDGLAYGADAIALDPQGNAPAGVGRANTGVRSISAPAPILETSADFYAGCAVMRFIRDNRMEPPGSPNYIGYQPWRTAMALLSYAADAETAAHELSDGAATYSPQKTAYQMQVERDQYGSYAPITCGTLCDSLPVHVGRTLCVGCPFFKAASGTPYRAAAQAETARHMAAQSAKADKPAGLTAPPDLAVLAPVPPAPVEDAPKTLDDYAQELIVADADDAYITAQKALAVAAEQNAHMFDAGALGMQLDAELIGGQSPVFADPASGRMFVNVRSDPKDENSPMEQVLAASMAFWPLRYVTIEKSDKRFVQIALMKFEQGRWLGRYAVLDYRHVFGKVDGFAAELGGLGVVLNYSPAIRRNLHAWFVNRTAFLQEAQVLSRAEHFGWQTHGDEHSFLLGNYRFRENGAVELATLSDALNSVKRVAFDLRGSVDGARSVLSFIGNYASDEMRFAVMASAGTPMMFKTSSPGAYVNLYGYNGKGKSLTGSIISGMWGNGAKNGAMISSKDTINARYTKLSSMCSLPIVHEEATTLHKEVNSPYGTIGAYLFEISQGRGKGRAMKDGSLQKEYNWSTIVFATSNIAIRDEMTVGDEERAAQVARAYEILFDRPAIAIGSDADNNAIMGRVGAAMDAASGVPGMLLASYYARHRKQIAWFTEQIDAYLTSKETETSAEQRVHRAILTAAYVGQYVLRAVGLWQLPDVEADAVIQRVHGRVRAGAATKKLDAEKLLSEIMASMQTNTAVIRTVVGAQGRTIPGTNFGVIYEPKLDLKARFDLMNGDTVALLSVRKADLVYALRQRHVDYDFFIRTLRAAGKQVTESSMDLHSQIHALTRDNKNVDALMPSVVCTSFVYAATPSSAAGGIPSINQLM